MADWLVESGIGEERALCLAGGEVVAAMLHWPGSLAPGQVEDARLVSRRTGSLRGTVRFANGEEALVDGLPRDAAEGSNLRAAVTRAAMAERGRFKRAQARLTDDVLRPAPTLFESLTQAGHAVQAVRRFPRGDWETLFTEAWDGTVPFDGGTLTITPTPAMTLIDIDGPLPPAALSHAAIPALAAAVRRFGLGGSIGIDFPSLEARKDRKSVDAALQAALADWPHQRTAMNGFGFVQLVARLERPSLLHRLHMNRTASAARLVLRQAELIDGPGRTLLVTVHPAVRGAICDDWEAQLSRRTGRTISWALDPALALEAGFAQVIA